MAETIRILIADDHPVVRRGLKAVLATEPGLEVVGEASNGREALDEALRLEPDVVLMDLVMPEMDGVEATRAILEKDAGQRIVVLTSFGSDEKVFPALQAGAVGFLLKETTPAELIRAIRQAASGQSTLSPAVARRVLRQMSGTRGPDEPVEELTPREMEVLREIAHGLSNDEIADKLDIRGPTVRTHVSHILAKLCLTRRTQAALYALRHGIAGLE